MQKKLQKKIFLIWAHIELFARPHLEVRLLQDPGQFSRAVIFNLETADVAQDLCHQLHIVVLHRLQLHLLQLFMSLEETEMLSECCMWRDGRLALFSYDCVLC